MDSSGGGRGALLVHLVTHMFWIWDIGLWLAVLLAGGWNVWRMFNRMPRAARGAARDAAYGSPRSW